MPEFLDLDALIATLPAPDLRNPNDTADYRSAVLVAIVRQLQILHVYSAERALQLHVQILKHLYALHALGLLDDERLALGLADLDRAYAREHPGLLELPHHD